MATPCSHFASYGDNEPYQLFSFAFVAKGMPCPENSPKFQNLYCSLLKTWHFPGSAMDETHISVRSSGHCLSFFFPYIYFY